MRSKHFENSVEFAVAPASNVMQAVPIQRKLAIGRIDDPLEHEADAMADKVMRMQTVPSVAAASSNNIQRKCEECEKDDEDKVQRKPLSSFIQRKSSANGNAVSDQVGSQINSSRGSGNGMDTGTRSFMERRFGADFSDVKIHTGNEAIQMNRELSAKAFTVGNDIYFNEREYQPASDSGRHLLAHELSHTIQQSNPNLIQRSCSDGNCETCAGGTRDLWITVFFRIRATRRTMQRLRAEINEAKRVLANCCINLKFNFNWRLLRGGGEFNWGATRPPGSAEGALDYSDDAELLGEGNTFDSTRGIPMLVVDNVPGTGGGATMISDPVVDSEYTGTTYIAVSVNQADENTSHSQIAHELWHVARNFNHDAIHGGIVEGTSDTVTDDYCNAMRSLV